jgi:topoisomerase-4 subunit B
MIARFHHLAAEVLDNSMDEAVAGHATRIEVRLDEGNRLTIADNGRGIPVDDPHPKFPGKSTLEVILLDAPLGRQVLGQGLCHQRRLAWRGHQRGQRAVRRTPGSRGRARPQLYRAAVLARGDAGPDRDARRDAEPARHHGRFTSLTPRFSATACTSIPSACSSSRAPRPICSPGVEIRWKCAPELIGERHPGEAVFKFPGGLADHLKNSSARANVSRRSPLRGGRTFPTKRRARRMGDCLAALERWLDQLVLQHRAHAGWRHA